MFGAGVLYCKAKTPASFPTDTEDQGDKVGEFKHDLNPPLVDCPT